MRVLAVLLVAAVAGSSALEMLEVGQPERNARLITANIDQYVDLLLGQVRKWIISKGMDPMQLEDIEKSFSVKPIIITYHGELELTKGWMQGVSNLKRGGAAELSYEAMFLNIKLPLLLESIMVDYDYLAKIMNLGPTGALDAKVTNLHLYVDLTIDTKTLELILQEFRITDSGSITVKFSGHPLIDWLANALTSLLTTLLHGLVQDKLQGEVYAMVEQAIQNFNDARPGHSSAAPTFRGAVLSAFPAYPRDPIYLP